VFSEATLYNGYTDTMEKMLRRLEMDLDYMKRQSVWLDIVIIFKTGVSILTGKKF
jgi:lipopolysaccharide/colanic/teichoic acid biosynthesis glycosyltransferase